MSLPSIASDGQGAAHGAQLAAGMQSFLAGLGVPFGVEHSAKCRPGGWSSERALFSAPVAACGVAALQRDLPAFLASLGMAESDCRAFMAELKDDEPPHFLHLGIEDSRCKAYWEAELPDAPPQGRFVLYRAWKWVPGDAAAVSDYVLVPSAPEAKAAIREQASRMPMSLVDLLEQLEVSFALKQVPWPPLTVRIEEQRQGQATVRQSLNLHLHQARLPLGAIAGLMMGLTREWESTARQSVVEWVAAHGDELLGNLSFGLGDDGQPFLTCYHGARLKQATS